MTAVDLSIIVPTYNEKDNLRVLVQKIATALEGIHWEVIFVDDDSPDGTAQAARRLAQEDPRVRCICRLGRRGLSSACIEGLLSSSAPYLAVMDADLQHDPALLPLMYAKLRDQPTNLVIASRYVAGGSVGQWNSKRLAISRLATRIATVIMRQSVADPMSGFFAIKRTTLEACVRDLSGLGFKILLDILASLKEKALVTEIPLTFGKRLAGESKLSSNVAWEFLLLLLDKLVGRYIPVRFLVFSSIGMLGVGVHFAVLSLLYRGLERPFSLSQTAATAVAILFNYTVNNLTTYADSRLSGAQWFKGLVSFYLICAIGAAANVGVASYMFASHVSWALSAVAGIALSAVWNYVISARYTWKKTT